MQSYQWYQCLETTCLFRCPAMPEELSNQQCPNCHGKMILADDTLPNWYSPLQMPQVEGRAMGLLLDNIRSIYNVGSLFRTADGVNVSHLFCCGMTATPEHPKVAKTALGAQSWHRWQYSTNGLQTAVSLKQQGWQIWVLEKTEQAKNLFELKQPSESIVLVAGNERAGVDPAISKIADCTMSLPMLGKKKSLNVAVATGIALYHLRFGGV